MGPVNRFQAVLTHLETRLQALFEGSMRRVFMDAESGELARLLASAMQAELKPQPDGALLAPNLFTLCVHPDVEDSLPDKASLLNGLAAILQEAGEEASYHFLAPPVLRITTDVELQPHEVRVTADFSLSATGNTSLIKVMQNPAGRRIQPASASPGKVKARSSLSARKEHLETGAFLIVSGGQTVPLTRQGLTIGRHPDMALVIDNPHVSRVHAQIRLVKGRFTIFDLDSRGGTFVNGQRVTQRVLHQGDVISLAGVQVVFGQEPSSSLEATQEINIEVQ